MRISDWSSDVCSSDLVAARLAARFGGPHRVAHRAKADQRNIHIDLSDQLAVGVRGEELGGLVALQHIFLIHGRRLDRRPSRRARTQIGRASWRDRGSPYVVLYVDRVTLKKIKIS